MYKKGAFEYFNIGPEFTKWIMLLYGNFHSCTINFCFTSEWFRPTRGLHQWACENPLIFLLVIEPLAIEIRNNEKIKGIKIGDEEIKSGQFADDMNLLLEAEEETLEQAISTLKNFQSNTGLKLNFEKSSVYRLGALKDTNTVIYTSQELRWTNESVTILGINVSSNTREMVLDNYNQILCKANEVMNDWKNRGLSIVGKTTVLNVLIGSLFVCKMSVLPRIPQSIVKRFNTDAWKYMKTKGGARLKFDSVKVKKAQGWFETL